MTNSKLEAGSTFPAMSWNGVSGGSVDPAGTKGWRLLIVYRGKHCPLCKNYLNTLNELLGDFERAQITVWALSADPQVKAAAQVEELGWKFPVGHDLTVEQMRQLGLYVSNPRSADETDRPFAEPGVFLINPDGRVQIVDISNAPFARPDLKSLLKGIEFVMDKGYPVRGTA